ncbi:MAG: hypothetical protein AAF497_04725, partial [Planctomycetota bacterium]
NARNLKAQPESSFAVPSDSDQAPAEGFKYLEADSDVEPESLAIQSSSQGRISRTVEEEVNEASDMMLDSVAAASQPQAPDAARIQDKLATLGQPSTESLRFRYVRNEDYDAVTNVRTDIRDFYQTLADNQIRVDQRNLVEKLDRKERGFNTTSQSSNFDSTVDLVLVEAKPEKLQKVFTALSNDSNPAFIVSNPNSQAEEQIQQNFTNVVAATPELVQEQAWMMQNVQRPENTRWQEQVPSADINQAKKSKELTSLGCRAICLGKVPQKAANGKGMTQLSLWAATPKAEPPAVNKFAIQQAPALPAPVQAAPAQPAPADRMLRRARSKANPDADAALQKLPRKLAEAEAVPPASKSEDQSEQFERVRMLFLIQEPEVELTADDVEAK